MADVGKEFDYIKSRQLYSIPGYGGHCPNLRAQYGNTYGNATKAILNERESERCCTSRVSSLCRRTHSAPEGESLTHLKIKSNNAESKAKVRPATAYSSVPLPYVLTHTGKRRDEVLSFNKVSHDHRSHYQDMTGTVHYIPSFTHRRVVSAPPTRFLATPTQEGPGTQEGARPYKCVSFVKYSAIPYNQLRHPKYTCKQPSAAEKRTRDVYFERR